MVKTASCNNKGAYSNSLVCSSLLSYIALRICTDKSSKGTRIPQTRLCILCIRVVKRALLTSISAKAAIAAYSGAVLYKDVNSKEKEISCQALSDLLGVNLTSCSPDWATALGMIPYHLHNRYLKTRTATLT